MIKKYLALRVRQYNDIVTFLQQQGVEILHSRLETRDQALRNFTEGLFDSGMERVIDRHELRWMLVQGELDEQVVNSWSLCELCLDEQWFENYKNNIRHYNGVAYWDATYGLAQELSLKPQDRQLEYTGADSSTEKETQVQAVVKEQASTTPIDVETASVASISTSKKRRKRIVVEECQLDLFA